MTSLIVLGVINISKADSNPLPSPTDLGKMKLIFNDDFNGNNLDTKKWTTCYDWYDSKNDGCSNYGNDESEWYTKDSVRVEDGNLLLSASKDEQTGLDKFGNLKKYPYKSGMVSTSKGGSDEARWLNAYGYYEARIYNPSGQGIWPAFWLLPTDGRWPPEIDIMELLGHEPNKILTTYFWRDGDKPAKDTSTFSSENSFANSWHTYGVDWKKGSISWYIDGKKVRTVNSINVPSENMSMILNLAVGGNLPGSPNESTPRNITMKIDYVRVFKHL